MVRIRLPHTRSLARLGIGPAGLGKLPLMLECLEGRCLLSATTTDLVDLEQAAVYDASSASAEKFHELELPNALMSAIARRGGSSVPAREVPSLVPAVAVDRTESITVRRFRPWMHFVTAPANPPVSNEIVEGVFPEDGFQGGGGTIEIGDVDVPPVDEILGPPIVPDVDGSGSGSWTSNASSLTFASSFSPDWLDGDEWYADSSSNSGFDQGADDGDWFSSPKRESNQYDAPWESWVSDDRSRAEMDVSLDGSRGMGFDTADFDAPEEDDMGGFLNLLGEDDSTRGAAQDADVAAMHDGDELWDADGSDGSLDWFAVRFMDLEADNPWSAELLEDASAAAVQPRDVRELAFSSRGTSGTPTRVPTEDPARQGQQSAPGVGEGGMIELEAGDQLGSPEVLAGTPASGGGIPEASAALGSQHPAIGSAQAFEMIDSAVESLANDSDEAGAEVAADVKLTLPDAAWLLPASSLSLLSIHARARRWWQGARPPIRRSDD